MIKRVLLFAVLTVLLCLVFFYVPSRWLASVAPADSMAEWGITILIGAGVGFAAGMWRRGNPWYVYAVAVLICLAARWVAYFALGLTCDFIVHCT